MATFFVTAIILGGAWMFYHGLAGELMQNPPRLESAALWMAGGFIVFGFGVWFGGELLFRKRD